jgi:isoaspartyl peptidase/L-asparaginase-like protein (Ntn-hydrolase superfamily)
MACDGTSFLVAVHVGAGSHARAKEPQYFTAMREACLAAAEVLQRGGAAGAAVVAAITVLEVGRWPALAPP